MVGGARQSSGRRSEMEQHGDGTILGSGVVRFGQLGRVVQRGATVALACGLSCQILHQNGIKWLISAREYVYAQKWW